MMKPVPFYMAVNEKSINLLQIINDISAAAFMCTIYAFFMFQYIYWPVIMLFFGITFINSYLNKKKLNLMCLWSLFFCIFCFISSFWTSAPAETRIVQSTLIKVLLVAISVSVYASDDGRINILLKGCIIGGVMLVIRLLISTPIDTFGVYRVGDSIDMNENELGFLLVFAALTCLYYSKITNLYFLIFILFSAATLFTGSRQALAMLFFAVVLYFMNRMKKPWQILYIIPLIVIIVIIVYISFDNPLIYHVLGVRIEGLLSLITGEGEVDNSSLVRMDLINIAIQKFKDHIFIGSGINSFRTLNKYRVYAHNNYVELLADVGLIGTILYYSMRVMMTYNLIIMYFKKKKNVFIALTFSLLIFLLDYGIVTYYSDITTVYLAISFAIMYNGGFENKSK